MSDANRQGPLVGYRVLELCTTIAGPACARLMADFGADVIKIEAAAGDPVRDMAAYDDDVSLYATSIFRNKRLVSINIKHESGRKLLLELVAQSDVVVENFRPGTLERLGLSYEVMSSLNPKIVLVRISGYGQSGPLSPKPGYGAICEAFAGLRHLTGEPDRPPSRVAAAVTDYLTAVYGAFGATLALLDAQRTGRGQVVDTALYEAAFSVMEPAIPAYDRKGIVPARAGSRLPGAAPNNLYHTRDGIYLLIAANNDAIFSRLLELMAQPELASDPRFSTMLARGENVDAVDAVVQDWLGSLDVQEARKKLEAAGVPSSVVNTMADIFQDEHFQSRDMLVEVPHPKLGSVTVAGVVPKLSRTPGAVYRLGGEVGEHTGDVLRDVLGLDEERVAELEREGAIAICVPHAAAPLEAQA